MQSPLNPQTLQLCRTNNQMAPPATEGAIAVPVPGLDFSAITFPDDEYLLDYSNQQAQGKFTTLQAVYVDNANNGSPLIITVQGSTGQRLIIPANAQAYLPILAQNPFRLTFQSAGNVTVPVELLNFPVAPCVWVP